MNVNVCGAVLLSIVIPVYNEEETIEKVVHDYFDTVVSALGACEIIIVDDASTDATPEILSNLQKQIPQMRIIRQQANCGHGQAIRHGYEAAKGEWVFQVDSDDQFYARDFWKLWEKRSTADFVLGVRKPRRDSLSRLVLSKLLQLFIFFRRRVWLRDANCPFRLMRRSWLVKILRTVPRASVVPNVLLMIAGQKERVFVDVEVGHKKRRAGKSWLGWKNLLNSGMKASREIVRTTP